MTYTEFVCEECGEVAYLEGDPDPDDVACVRCREVDEAYDLGWRVGIGQQPAPGPRDLEIEFELDSETEAYELYTAYTQGLRDGEEAVEQGWAPTKP